MNADHERRRSEIEEILLLAEPNTYLIVVNHTWYKSSTLTWFDTNCGAEENYRDLASEMVYRESAEETWAIS